MTPAAALVLAAALLVPGPTHPPGSCRIVDGRADATCTPGTINPAVTQANIATTICRPGWTATVRPPESYTRPRKLASMRDYGEPTPASLYEYDHLVSLEIGGSPTDERNLFPEPYAGPLGARVKDRDEDTLHRAVCAGRMTLTAAQHAIVAKWTTGGPR